MALRESTIESRVGVSRPGMARRKTARRTQSRYGRVIVEVLEARQLLSVAAPTGDALLEVLSRGPVYQAGALGANHSWQKGDDVDAGWGFDSSYMVNKVFSQANGFFALGLTSTIAGADPILVVRGTHDLGGVYSDFNPNGVGYNQFTSERADVESWLQGFGSNTHPVITGQSLGGALAQWFAADYTAQYKPAAGSSLLLDSVVTFNSPGISQNAAAGFVASEVGYVHHYIASADIVSMAGQAFIAGGWSLGNFSDMNFVNRHTNDLLVANSIGTMTRPADLTTTYYTNVSALNDPQFTYRDPQYLALVGAAELVTKTVPVLNQYSNVASALMFRGTTEAVRQQLGTAIDSILPYASNTAIGSSITVALPATSLNLGGINISAQSMTLTWNQAAGSFRIQGTATVSSMFSATANFTGSNYIEILPDHWNVVGSLSVQNAVLVPGSWTINSAYLYINTVAKTVSASATVTMPGNIQVNGSISFINGQMNQLGVSAYNMNEPIAATGLMLQSISGSVNHLAAGQGSPVFSGSLEITFGPKLTTNLPSFLGGTFSGALGDLTVSGTIDSNCLNVSGNLRILGGIITAQASAVLNWSQNYLQVSSSLNVLGGFISASTYFTVNSSLNLSMSGTASLQIPNGVPLFGGDRIASGNYKIQYSNDGNSSNDYIAAWGSPFWGVTAGLEIWMNGSWSVLTHGL